MDRILDRNVTRLTQGSIGKALFSLSLPLVLSNTLQTGYQVVNMFWVGRLGSAAVAAVSVSFPVIFLLVSLGSGLSVAGSILVAQYAGARDSRQVNQVSAQSVVVVVAVSAIFSAIGLLVLRPILHGMQIAPEIFEDSACYLRVSFLSIVFSFSFAIFQSILRGVGQVKTPLYVMAFSVVLNLLLDPLFIFGWGPFPAGGVVGAAYATLVTQALGTAVGFGILLSRRHGVRLHAADFIPALPLIGRVFRLGLPTSIEQSMDALGIVVMTTMVSSFGTQAIAVYGIGFRVLIILIIPAFSISIATSTLVGQNLGAGNLSRIPRTGALSAAYAFWLLTAAAAIVFATAEDIVRFLVPHDARLIREGATAVRFMTVSSGFLGAYQSLVGALRGAGNTLIPMVLTLIEVWVIQIPVAYVLAEHTSLGETGLWVSFPVSAVLIAVLAMVCFPMHRWKRLELSRPSSG